MSCEQYKGRAAEQYLRPLFVSLLCTHFDFAHIRVPRSRRNGTQDNHAASKCRHTVVSGMVVGRHHIGRHHRPPTGMR